MVCGVQTARALENFPISGIQVNHYPGFVEAWAIVKLAAARANTEVGATQPETLAAIEKACQAVLDGEYHDQFVVDWYQGGAETSTNMNANEGLANIALELSGHAKGQYEFVDRRRWERQHEQGRARRHRGDRRADQELPLVICSRLVRSVQHVV